MFGSAPDQVTGLPGRTAFCEVVEKFSAEAKTSHHGKLDCALLLIDLNRFSMVNQAFGDRGADQVLAQVGARILLAVGSAGYVARLAGNEFGVFAAGLAGRDGVEHLVKRIQAISDRPYSLEDCDFRIGFTIGAVIEPAGSWSECRLIRKADAALRKARTTKSDFEFFTEDLDVDQRSRIRMVEEIRAGLDDNAFHIYYQPKVSTKDHRVVGFEGLVRWHHRTGQVLLPSSFLSVVEEEGLMRRLTGQVIDAATGQGAEWSARECPVDIAVNVSEEDLVGPRLPEKIAESSKRAGFDCRYLTIEISERMVASGNPEALKTIFQLKEMGCRIALDDFGAGVTSLAHLRQLPIDELKIDRGFSQSVVKCPKSRVIFESTVEMATRLGMDVVAEGVECLESFEIISRLGVSSVQGFLFSHAVTAEDASGLLKGRLNAYSPLPRSMTPEFIHI